MKKLFLVAGTLLSIAAHSQTTPTDQSKPATAAHGKSNTASQSTAGKNKHSNEKQYMGEKVKREGITGTKKKYASGSTH